jgi:hypothetical protein
MIGVFCSSGQERLIAEFFELFKTPWQFARIGRRYPVSIVTTAEIDSWASSDVMISYGLYGAAIDERLGLAGEDSALDAELSWNQHRFPVYGGAALFSDSGKAFIRHIASGRSVGIEARFKTCRIYRIGVDLVRQVERLLSVGQPIQWATIPTLELHIAILRNLIVAAGVQLVEIPPSPLGTTFSLCVTHDVDFAGIHFHGLDRTVIGFLLRATFGSVVRLLQGDLRLAQFFFNLFAALSLPLVYCGAIPDFRTTAGSKATYGPHTSSSRSRTGTAERVRGASHAEGHADMTLAILAGRFKNSCVEGARSAYMR